MWRVKRKIDWFYQKGRLKGFQTAFIVEYRIKVTQNCILQQRRLA
jgi:hypothetical protein